MGRRRCRRSTSSGKAAAAAPLGTKPPSRTSPLLTSLAFLVVSSTLSGRAQAFFVSTRVRGIHTSHSRRMEQQLEKPAREGGRVAMMSERRGLWPGRPTIDLRSDTVTQPTGGMRKAMQKVRPLLEAALQTCCFRRRRKSQRGPPGVHLHLNQGYAERLCGNPPPPGDAFEDLLLVGRAETKMCQIFLPKCVNEDDRTSAGSVSSLSQPAEQIFPEDTRVVHRS